jgi:hypothetical protein
MVGAQDDPAIVTDGAGGMIIVWQDARTGFADIYAQRIDKSGTAVWAAGGVAVCTATGEQYDPVALLDGLGGVIIAWEDRRTGAWDIYANRLDLSGNVLWTTNGVAICTAGQDQYDPVIDTDTDGGAIIAWSDPRTLDHDVYAQHVNSSGTALWTANGVGVCTVANTQFHAVMVSDDNGGAVIVWEDYRSGIESDIYAARIDFFGTTVWTGPVSVAASDQENPVIAYAFDGGGGAVCAWTDYRSGTDVYAQRINAGGTPLWTTNGVRLCNNIYAQYYPEIIWDASGGTFVMWSDTRNQTDIDVYGQRLNSSGVLLWDVLGLPISTATGDQWPRTMVPSVSDGAIVVFEDTRNGIYDLYAQRVDGAGNTHWTAGGVPVCDNGSDQGFPEGITDGDGGIFVAWQDQRGASGSDIYAQAIDAAGDWGYPSPVVQSVLDVPGDQGGWVNLSWYGSRYDTDPNEEITQYTIWRALGPSQVAAMMSAGATIADIPLAAPAGNGNPMVRQERVGAQTWFWELIDSHDAFHLSAYSKVVPTLFDSSAVATEYHYYQVIAHTSDPYVFWASAPDSGYSVDNLAPAMPMALAGQQSMLPEGLDLTWLPNSEADLANYRVYRETTPDFTPSPANLIASPADTTFLDTGWQWDSGFWYKVVAVDLHGNESPFAILGPNGVTGIDDAIPRKDYLSQNYPNPFNPTTTIVFGLKEPADVKVRIYDASGRLVRTVVNRHYEAGGHVTAWDGRDDAGARVASGVYFCKLDSGRSALMRKIVLLK